jgi:hypothetical protein
MSRPSLNIVVSGMIAADPFQGGATWSILQYVLGLRVLGHRVLLIEPVPPTSLLPKGVSLTDSQQAAYFRKIVVDFGLTDDAVLLLAQSQETVGLDYRSVQQRAMKADLLINVSGMLTDESLLEHIPIRAYLDLDPAFVQCWHAQGLDMRFSVHTHFITVGQNIGSDQCPVPTCGISWIKTFQPIVLDQWPRADRLIYDGLTTIANWRGYGSVENQGVVYGQKAHSLRQFFQVPMETKEKFMVALAIHPEEVSDLTSLKQNNWQLLDPMHVAGSPHSYREFIQGSKAEFGIAKSGYALSNCGWFSDRSVCYLASGRPVIAMDTGFRDCLPLGEGLLAFATGTDILNAIDIINRNYEKHRRAARDLAEEYFEVI